MSQIFSLGAVASRRVIGALVVVLIASVPFVAAPASGKPTPQAALKPKPPAAFKLVASATAERTNPAPLQNRTVTGALHVFVAPAEGIKGVRYLVDGKPIGTRKGFSTMPLAHGPHTAEAVIRLAAGRRATARARFTIEHLFVGPTGSDTGRCSSSRPCLSLDKAYHSAVAGQVVELAAGAYGEQTINVDASKTSDVDVVIRPSKGAAATIGSMHVYGKHLALQDVKIDSVDFYDTADDVIFRNIDMKGFWIWSATNISIVGGAVGPLLDLVPYVAYGKSQVPPRNILIDGVLFHDILRSSESVHAECLMVSGGDGVTIRNSRFTRCAVMDLFFTSWTGPGEPKNVVLENNFFDAPVSGGFYAIAFKGGDGRKYENFLIRNNSLNGSISLEDTPYINSRIVANVGQLGRHQCHGQIAYSYNVWTDARCGSTDRKAPSGFVDPTKFNLHLAPGSRAINAGDPKSFPLRDIDGQRRPIGKRADSGADEAR
jgi:hypothetical protein